MKKILAIGLLAVFVILGILSFKQVSHPIFYYTFSTKKMLKIHPDKVLVRYRDKVARQTASARIQQLAAGSREDWVDARTVVMDLPSKSNAAGLMETLRQQPDVITTHPIYLADDVEELGLTDEFMVQFREGISSVYIDSLNKAYGVTILKKASFYYLLQAPANANAMDIANQYQETGMVNFSHPNFIMKPQVNAYIPNDPYFSSQWNFRNTGQLLNDGHTGTAGADIKAPEAWDITKGNSSIVVAVIDEGVTPNHPDLPNSRQVRLPGSNFGDGDPNDPSATGNMNHGNACAGLIAATQDNNEGITGLAPLCRIMPIRIFRSNGDGVAANLIADALTFAYQHGADVISNSWGFSSADNNLVPAIVTAIQNATTQGRGGKGCVVAFSAGNNAQNSAGNHGYVGFPSNVNIDGVLTVGASDRFDRQAEYSPFSQPLQGRGSMIEVVAPSHRAYPTQISGETLEIWSIDVPGNTGYNPWSDYDIVPPAIGEQLPSAGTNFNAYTGRFGGTSAACPQVAALAALILSVNPNLTQLQVYNNITGSADKVGGYNYGSTGASFETGYGRINAYQALLKTLSAMKPTFSASNPANICGDATANFSITPVPQATSYTYTIEGGAAGANVVFTTNNQLTLTTTATTVSLTFPSIMDSYYSRLYVKANFGSYSTASNDFLFSYVAYNVQWTPDFTWSHCGGPGDYFDVAVTPLAGASAYYWYIDDFLYDVTTGPNSICGSYNGEKILMVQAKTTCGMSAKMGANIPCAYGPALARNVNNVVLYPNPATSAVTVNLLPVPPAAKDQKKVPATAKMDSKTQQPVESIRQILILDKMGNRKGQYQYPSGVKTATISIQHLPKDVYYLQVSDGVHQSNLPLIKTE
ncbi:S8 family serine peptidase [Chitinophaga qingshengii]|uniref:S8 family serine peptidase n=1 Tax=Chitinophaga qingshengii TaxID=1569794 RepID=A0ABR7TKN8_9BACT|nr:S8 family serine peptidase [Chitinophaga qingshengii]MBC9930103.1 S8 family serine peptidase [Chitinophaga qingshengii]